MASDQSVFGLSTDQTLSWRNNRYVYPSLGIFLILVVTVLSGYFTHEVVYSIQVRRFKRDYHALTDSAVILLRKGLDEKILGARALSAVISGAFPIISEWPFVYLYNSRKIVTTISPATQISFAPIVTPEQASEFEDFALRSYNRTYGPEVARKLFGIGIFAPVNISCYECARYHDVSGNTSYGSPNHLMTPLLQGNFSTQMFNMHSDELRGTTIDKVIDCAHSATSVTEMESCGAITTPTFTFVNPTVASIVFFPVFPARNVTSLSGLTVIGLKWNEILETLFPATVSGVYCVLRTDNTAYTFVISGGRVSKVLLEDASAETLVSFARSAPVTETGFLRSTSAEYTLTFYPTHGYWSQYVDDGPLYTALIVVFVVLTLSGAAACGLYFYSLRRKASDSATMAKAKRLFIRYISHEIRTPLNTVSLGLNLLLCEMNTPASSLKPSYLLSSPSKYGNNSDNCGSGGSSGYDGNGGNSGNGDNGGNGESCCSSGNGGNNGGSNGGTFASGISNSSNNIEWRRLVAELIENSQCAVMLLDDLLSFEQLENTRRESSNTTTTNNNNNNTTINNNNYPVEMQILPVWELIRLSVSSFSVRAKLSDVQLHSELEVDQADLSAERKAAMEGLRVLGNEAQLKRVVGSLLGNALQYSHEGGEIRVTSCWVERDSVVKEKERDREKEMGREKEKKKGKQRDTESTRKDDNPARRRTWSRLYQRNRARTNTSTAPRGSDTSSWGSDRAGMTRAGIVRVSVTDQGAGMTPEQTAQVFGKDRRFSIQALQAGQGSGIGLFVCKIIAEQHHASIRVTSPGVGLGSTYTLDLPVFAASPPALHTDSSSVNISASMQSFMLQPLTPRASSHVTFQGLGTVAEVEAEDEEVKNEEVKEERKEKEGLEQLPIGVGTFDSIVTAPQFLNKRILVVDDAPSNRKMLIRVLSKSGHQCEQAQDGQVALDMVERAGPDNLFDMILMDYEMPVMNGPTATRLLRECGCTCPIVGVTGNVLSADVEFFVAQGADAVLPKPLQMASLDAVWKRKMQEEAQMQQDLAYDV